MIVVDTGPLVAAALTSDANHQPCVELFASLRLNNEQLVVPPFVVTEVCYLLARSGGPKPFVRSLASEDFTIGPVTPGGLDRRHFSVVRPRHVDAFTLLP
ncbi:hypothetical protein OHA10_03610 [Kribbella sp. NBC_00662]|uniref:type II toxin-antitoxin system VapC family toxin n=1 Tax=Kribbella sp. NBC_00662 TaxID=2975969 RepID=UPI00325613F6